MLAQTAGLLLFYVILICKRMWIIVLKKVTCVIGIILYNSELDILSKNIKDLLSGSFDAEVILLDNTNGNSEQEIIEFFQGPLKDLASKIHYYKSENIGFGAGHNKIFEIAKQQYDFEYYLCCNPDGIAKYDLLDKLITFAKERQDKGLFEARQFPIEHPKIYNPKTKETAWCSGCCVLAPKAVYEKLNGFDDDFFMYMEDVDLSWRNKQLGNKCYIVDDALFSHSVDNSNRDMTFTKKKMFESAYILGKKYSQFFFTLKYLRYFKKFADKNEVDELEKREIKKNKNYRYTDFGHDLSFSKVRSR